MSLDWQAGRWLLVQLSATRRLTLSLVPYCLHLLNLGQQLAQILSVLAFIALPLIALTLIALTVTGLKLLLHLQNPSGEAVREMAGEQYKAKSVEKALSPVGRRNFLRLIQHKLRGKFYTLVDMEKILQILLNEIRFIPLPPITGVELFLADGCNLNCSYCFEGLKPKRLMPLELAQKAMERLLKEWSGDEKVVRVALFGGEPLLNWPVLKRVVEYAREISQGSEKYVSFFLTTNGTLLNAERVRFLKEHQVFVMISMDGLPSTHDRHRRTAKDRPSFPLVWKGLQLLREHYETFDVRMTVMPDTAPLLFDSVMFLLECGANNLVVVPALGVEWSPSDRKVYWQQIRKIIEYFRNTSKQELSQTMISPVRDLEVTKEFVKREAEKLVQNNFGCYAGVNNVAVTSSGEIFPCAPFVGNKELKESYRLGSVQEGVLDDFRRQELFVLNRHRGLKCNQCALRSFCEGGCMVANYYATGYLIEPDPMTCQKTGFYVSLAKRQVYEACLASGLTFQEGGKNESRDVGDLLGP